VLEYRNTKLRWLRPSWDEALTRRGQAKNYAGKLEIRHTYSTNGQGVYAIDMDTGSKVRYRTFRRQASSGRWCSPSQTPGETACRHTLPDKSGTWDLRFYQELAVNRVLEAIETGRDRVLLTLATGTGKTSIAFQIAWKLFKAVGMSKTGRPNEPQRQPRILFLADAIRLQPRRTTISRLSRPFLTMPWFVSRRSRSRKRAASDQRQHLLYDFPNLHERAAKDGKPSPYFGAYPKDFFDLIIIDECHRGGATMKATGAASSTTSRRRAAWLDRYAQTKRDVDTYQYFGEPVFVYSLKDGSTTVSHTVQGQADFHNPR